MIILHALTDSTQLAPQPNSSVVQPTSYWMWIAIFEFVIIGILFYRRFAKRSSDSNPLMHEALSGSKHAEVDMGDLMNSINLSRTLYKQLSVKCHPDRFPRDEEKRKIADSLLQEITRNKRNYKRLLEIKALAEQQLNLTI